MSEKANVQKKNKENDTQIVSDQDMAEYLRQFAAFLLTVFSENKIISGGRYGECETNKK